MTLSNFSFPWSCLYKTIKEVYTYELFHNSFFILVRKRTIYMKDENDNDDDNDDGDNEEEDDNDDDDNNTMVFLFNVLSSTGVSCRLPYRFYFVCFCNFLCS